jgi:transposase
MATIIGIDVSKNELIGVRINRAGKEVENYKFGNNSDSISTFLTDIAQKQKHVVIACESTSYFHRNLALACIKQDIPFRLINPITTKQFVKVTVRGRKTDMSDALIIAKLALHGEGRYMQIEDFSFNKSIFRTASKLSEMGKVHWMYDKLAQYCRR